MRRKLNPFTVIGLLCLTAAAAFAIKNIHEDLEAGNYAEEVLTEVEDAIGDISEVSPDEPDYILNPDMDMPEEIIDGLPYIGYIEFKSLDIRLPIISEWSYPNLKKAPCRYYGTVYRKNMVIAAHNYQKHFGRLRDLTYGDEITITDMDGNVFEYTVFDVEILGPYDTEDMIDSDADLTLFTCTIGGKTRVTVRCSEKQDAG